MFGLSLRTREDPWTKREAMYVKYIGELFLNMLKGIIIPLIIPSLISTIGSMDIGLSGKVGLRAVAYYLSTTAFAVTMGIVLVVSIRPGDLEAADHDRNGTKRNVLTADTLMDLVRNFFPRNIIQATIQQHRTEIIDPTELFLNDANFSMNDSTTGAPILLEDKNTWDFEGKYSNSSNIVS